MTDRGTHLIVEAGERDLQELLEIVRTQGRTVRIEEGGKVVAELSPPAPRRQLEPVDPRLRATLHVAGHELTTEADWPEEMRIDVDRSCGPLWSW